MASMSTCCLSDSLRMVIGSNVPTCAGLRDWRTMIVRESLCDWVPEKPSCRDTRATHKMPAAGHIQDVCAACCAGPRFGLEGGLGGRGAGFGPPGGPLGLLGSGQGRGRGGRDMGGVGGGFGGGWQ